MNSIDHIARLHLRLLQGKTWRYLRYLHFRDYLSRVAGEIESVAVCGSGHGWAELACAIEFPHIKFTLTDIVVKGLYPNYHGALDLAWQWGVNNFQCSVWNVLRPTDRRFDLVASTEMLEHVPDIVRAVKNMRGAAIKYVYCLVPFADDVTNCNPAKRKGAFDRHEHLVFGLDRVALESLFGVTPYVAGAYWADAGQVFRKKLQGMTTDEISAAVPELVELAALDLRNGVPSTLKDAAGIKLLAYADAEVPAQPVLPPSLQELLGNDYSPNSHQS